MSEELPRIISPANAQVMAMRSSSGKELIVFNTWGVRTIDWFMIMSFYGYYLFDLFLSLLILQI